MSAAANLLWFFHQGDDKMRRFFGAAGSESRLVIKSEVLGTNILGDPTSRAVDVYIPAGHDGRGLPLLVDLVGITSSGLSHTNWMAFSENMPERLDRLIGEGRMAPVVVAFPDCFTRMREPVCQFRCDRGFELCYLPDMPATLRALAPDGSIAQWW
jgi:hypothetical protein